MNNGFTKLFGTILTSTVWQESDKTRIVWITMLALADRDGEVAASVPGLANVANVSVEDCLAALEKFKAPDEYSRTKTPECGGRRIEEIPGGFRLLNYKKYREDLRSQERRDYLREKQAESRARKRQQVSTSQPSSTAINQDQPIAEAEAEAVGGQKASKPAGAAPTPPKTSEQYIAELKKRPAYKGIDIDREFDKMVIWNQVRGKKPTERKLVAWLNRIEMEMVRTERIPSIPREVR